MKKLDKTLIRSIRKTVMKIKITFIDKTVNGSCFGLFN